MNFSHQPDANDNTAAQDKAASTLESSTPAAATPPAGAARRGGQLLRLGLAVSAGVLAGFGLQHGVDSWRAHQQATSFDVVARPAPRLAQAQVHIRSWLVFGDQLHALKDGQIALPSGSRFAFRVESPVAGRLSLHAVNPRGESSAQPLWTGRVGAFQSITTGTLRLDGEKGRETLVIRLEPGNGDGPVVSQHVHLWHL